MTPRKPRRKPKKERDIPAVSSVEGYTFTDSQGTVWDVELNLGAARRVDRVDYSELTDIEFSFLNPANKEFVRVLDDTSVVFAIIFAICEPQVEQKLGIKIEDEESRELAEITFCERIKGASIEDGKRALWRSVGAFFHEHQIALSTLQRQHDKARKRLEQELRSMAPEIEKAMDTELEDSITDLKAQFEKRKKELAQKRNSGGISLQSSSEP